MSELKAIHYGQVELIPGVICDGYVLDDQTAVMSERGVAGILGMARQSLNSMSVKWPPKYLKPFIDSNLSMSAKLVEVTAPNSYYQGRKIAVYTAAMVENLICGYALAFANDCLRKNQKHIGKIAVALMRTLVRTALATPPSKKLVVSFLKSKRQPKAFPAKTLARQIFENLLFILLNCITIM